MATPSCAKQKRPSDAPRLRDDGALIATASCTLRTRSGATGARGRAASCWHGLGFSPADLERRVAAFSGGWRMRLNLAQALMCRVGPAAAR